MVAAVPRSLIDTAVSPADQAAQRVYYASIPPPAPAHNFLAFCGMLVLTIWVLLLIHRLRQTLILRTGLRLGQVANIHGLAPYIDVFRRMCRPHLNAVIRTRRANPPKQVSTFLPLVDLDLTSLEVITNAQEEGFSCRFEFHCRNPCLVQVVWDCSIEHVQHLLDKEETLSTSRGGVFTPQPHSHSLNHQVALTNGPSMSSHWASGNDVESGMHFYGQPQASGSHRQVATRISNSLQTLLPINLRNSRSTTQDNANSAEDPMAVTMNEVAASIELSTQRSTPPVNNNSAVSTLEMSRVVSTRNPPILLGPDFMSSSSVHAFSAGQQVFQPSQEDYFSNFQASLRRWRGQDPPTVSMGRCPLVICFVSQSSQGIKKQLYSFDILLSADEEPKDTPRIPPPLPTLTPRLSQQLCKVSPDNKSEDFLGEEIFLIKEIFGLDDSSSQECVVCLTDPKDITFLPCRHLCVCKDCSKHVDKCPVCRSPFENYVGFDRSKLNSC
mmetsp:Transcript_25383/g.33140  ORF Transcript_25383/g.33140 Transcript_25383/m.33140 type:complete len:497 (+) Transcript_25383:213-1703(+)